MDSFILQGFARGWLGMAIILLTQHSQAGAWAELGNKNNTKRIRKTLRLQEQHQGKNTSITKTDRTTLIHKKALED